MIVSDVTAGRRRDSFFPCACSEDIDVAQSVIMFAVARASADDNTDVSVHANSHLSLRLSLDGPALATLHQCQVQRRR